MIQTNPFGFSSATGKFPPITTTAVFGSGSVVPPQFNTNPSMGGILQTSNVIVAPTAASYANIPMPHCVSIPGYSFPDISLQ